MASARRFEGRDPAEPEFVVVDFWEFREGDRLRVGEDLME
jgi:hypothetical protein